MNEKLALCAEDDDTRVVVITGGGKHFCTGGDVRRCKDCIANQVYLTMDERFRGLYGRRGRCQPRLLQIC
ncbi:enoyl-CoA hydratase/isomerase family protein [Intestinimonas butyriciproducens]|uniref:enoyl-CoA hydratase/isomerase family protein n=1 Tax=Intestinimonas butyriciproducens TaxID=1297617 RepID=UPI001AB03880|nr:enoyl-CoA hydratase/isomerase family protein [Intestinimonas butyriciproducens]MBO3281411.1 hypothetical protein [Intestinimonas butyriciproducens]MBS6523275.1 enoyl-CoA hydratase/isomerase family protein [Clostridiales bacterium]